MVRKILRSSNKRALAYTCGNYAVVSVFEENHPKITKFLVKKVLDRFWQHERENHFFNIEGNLSRAFNLIDLKLKELSAKTGTHCIINSFTLLIVKRTIFVYNAGTGDLKFLDKFGLRDYIKYDNKPYGELEPEAFWPVDCLRLSRNCKFLLMTDGVSKSIDRKGVADRFNISTSELADLIYHKAVKEGRYEPSLACIEDEVA